MMRLRYLLALLLTLAAGPALAQGAQCPNVYFVQTLTASSYTVKSTDNCWWIVIPNSGTYNIQLPAPGLIFAPGFSVTLLPENSNAVLALTQLPDDNGKLHQINGQTNVTFGPGQGVQLKIQQDLNWYALPATPSTGGGLVTNITADAPLTASPNPITAVGHIAMLSSGVTPGPYTNANITVDGYGRVTTAANGSSGVSVTAGTSDVVINPTPGTGTFTVGTTQPLNDQSGGGYAILTGDNSALILVGTHTYTLPQAGTTGFTTGWTACLLNISGGSATVTTTTSVFAGAGGGTSVTVPSGAWICPTSNGTNYDTLSSGVTTGTVTSVSNSDVSLTISPTTGAVVASLNVSHANTWAAAQTFTNSDIKLLGSSTGATTFTSANAGASNFTLTFPAATGTLAALGLAQTWTGAQTFGEVIGTLTTQSGTTYTLAATDCGTTVLFTSGSAITVTTLNSLPIGCAIAIEQGGAGQITIANGSGATSHSAHSFTKTFGQYAILGLFVDTNAGGAAADVIITGDGA